MTISGDEGHGLMQWGCMGCKRLMLLLRSTIHDGRRGSYIRFNSRAGRALQLRVFQFEVTISGDESHGLIQLSSMACRYFMLLLLQAIHGGDRGVSMRVYLV